MKRGLIRWRLVVPVDLPDGTGETPKTPSQNFLLYSNFLSWLKRCDGYLLNPIRTTLQNKPANHGLRESWPRKFTRQMNRIGAEILFLDLGKAKARKTLDAALGK